MGRICIVGDDEMGRICRGDEMYRGVTGLRNESIIVVTSQSRRTMLTGIHSQLQCT